VTDAPRDLAPGALLGAAARHGRAAPALGWTVRLALRELRGGWRGFLVFIACIALGVMAIAGIGSFAQSLADGLAHAGRAILGGDVAVALIQREADPAERAFLDATGTVSTTATMRAMARAADGRTALVELKAVDARYPLYGKVGLEPTHPLADVLTARDGVYGAAAESALLTKLGLPLGARVTVGAATIELRAVLTSEPDRLAGGVGFGPRLLVGADALRASGLLRPGSLVRWHYQVRLPANTSDDRAAAAVAAEAKSKFPDAGWDIRTGAHASPSLERNIERFSQFLTLIGLTALLVGGVGVANAVGSHIERRRDVIATLKALGASGGRVVALYLVQVLVLAAIGSAIGLALGAALPFVIAALFGAIIPLPLAPSLHAGELLLASGYGLITALAFALWPLGRAHDVPVAALFRDLVAPERRWPRARYGAAAAAALAAFATLATLFAFDRFVAVIFLGAVVAVIVALRMVAFGLMFVARRLPRARSPVVRLAIANIHRPGALTPTVVLSLGLGLTLLVTVALIDGNLRRQFTAALPAQAPSFFFVDIQRDDAARFTSFVATHAPDATLETAPMLRGRIVAVNGRPVDTLHPPDTVAWALRGDRGVTYADSPPAGSTVVDGAWWPADYSGPALVSLEKRIADGIGLKVGDPITVNVLGRKVTATVANLRSVDWQSLGINFVLVYSPVTFRAAPHTAIATLTYADGATPAREDALLQAVAQAFPAITVVQVRAALEAIGALLAGLVTAVRSASLLCIVAAVLVLGGALGASHRHRVYDAVILKTLGATRRQLLASYALEYCALGIATAAFGTLAGSLAAWYVVAEVMHARFAWLPLTAFVPAITALLVTVALGLIGTLRALGHKPAPVLRHL
jgi:putative ABC transport system permease protein